MNYEVHHSASICIYYLYILYLHEGIGRRPCQGQAAHCLAIEPQTSACELGSSRPPSSTLVTLFPHRFHGGWRIVTFPTAFPTASYCADLCALRRLFVDSAELELGEVPGEEWAVVAMADQKDREEGHAGCQCPSTSNTGDTGVQDSGRAHETGSSLWRSREHRQSHGNVCGIKSSLWGW